MRVLINDSPQLIQCEKGSKFKCSLSPHGRCFDLVAILLIITHICSSSGPTQRRQRLDQFPNSCSPVLLRDSRLIARRILMKPTKEISSTTNPTDMAITKDPMIICRAKLGIWPTLLSLLGQDFFYH